MYKVIRGPNSAHIIFKLLWKASSVFRHKIFFWLILHSRLNTRNLFHTKNIQMSSYNYSMCSSRKLSLCFPLSCYYRGETEGEPSATVLRRREEEFLHPPLAAPVTGGGGTYLHHRCRVDGLGLGSCSSAVSVLTMMTVAANKCDPGLSPLDWFPRVLVVKKI